MYLSVPELVLLLDVLAFHGLSDHALSVLGHSLLLEVLQQLLKVTRSTHGVRSYIGKRWKEETRPSSDAIPERHSNS